MKLSSSIYNLNQLRDYSSVFTRREANAVLNCDFSSLNAKISRYDSAWYSKPKATYLTYLKHIYKVLENHYRNEYVYKNTFLNQWLIKELGQDNSIVYNEFRVGSSIADLVMFNGNSRVFEIKTELDSDKRLKTQLEDYFKIFNEVFLIIPEFNLNEFINLDSRVGIITFKNTNTFEVIKKPSYNTEIDAVTLMHLLRVENYKSIVKTYYGNLPEMTSFTQFDICKNYMKRIPKQVLNKLFINEVKKRKKNESLSKNSFKELNQISLALNMSLKQKETFIFNLRSPISI